MTQQEIIQSIKKLKAYFPYYYSNVTKEDAKAIVEVWEDHFGKLDNKYMESAIKSWGMIHDKPPTIADLRKCVGSNYSIVDKEYSSNNLTAEEKELLGKQREILWDLLCGR